MTWILWCETCWFEADVSDTDRVRMDQDQVLPDCPMCGDPLTWVNLDEMAEKALKPEQDNR